MGVVMRTVLQCLMDSGEMGVENLPFCGTWGWLQIPWESHMLQLSGHYRQRCHVVCFHFSCQLLTCEH